MRQKIGELMVDSGTMMLGDPCYTLPDDGSNRTEDIKDWHKTCDNVLPSKEEFKMFNDGIALFFHTGWGDGTYPVYATIEGGRISKVEVIFDEQQDEEERCPYCGLDECECDSLADE